MTEDLIPSVDVRGRARQRLKGGRDHFFAFVAIRVLVELPLISFFLPLAGPTRGFRVPRHHDATGEDSLRLADRLVRRARLPIETDGRTKTLARLIAGRVGVRRGFVRSDGGNSERKGRRR